LRTSEETTEIGIAKDRVKKSQFKVSLMRVVLERYIKSQSSRYVQLRLYLGDI